jgi:PTH1 family peptidyl-tRNA hydrolase
MTKLIVGLANPGAKYARTRHNVGAWLVEALASDKELDWKLESKFHGLIAQFTHKENPIRLLIPTTYMNLSGQAVQAMAQFYRIDPTEILVVHDELDLDAGVARLKFDGGHGGHNGLRNIFEKLGSSKFYRIRIGIGKPQTQQSTVDFVLQPPLSEEKDLINSAIERAEKIIPLLLKGEFNQAMKELNTEK